MPYTWNEGIARAARHYLNDYGSCGSAGDKNAMGFAQILSAYYVWNYFDLEFEIIETDYLVNDADWSDSSQMGFAYILTQESINNDMLMYQHEKEMGIGCACNGREDGKHICIIATVDRAPIRDIQERIPINQHALTGEETCSDRCAWFGQTGWDDAFYTNTTYCTDNSMYQDASGFCRSCEDQTAYCSLCDITGCIECK